MALHPCDKFKLETATFEIGNVSMKFTAAGNNTS